jgi:hypothetical protein
MQDAMHLGCLWIRIARCLFPWAVGSCCLVAFKYLTGTKTGGGIPLSLSRSELSAQNDGDATATGLLSCQFCDPKFNTALAWSVPVAVCLVCARARVCACVKHTSMPAHAHGPITTARTGQSPAALRL